MKKFLIVVLSIALALSVVVPASASVYYEDVTLIPVYDLSGGVVIDSIVRDGEGRLAYNFKRLAYEVLGVGTNKDGSFYQCSFQSVFHGEKRNGAETDYGNGEFYIALTYYESERIAQATFFEGEKMASIEVQLTENSSLVTDPATGLVAPEAMVRAVVQACYYANYYDALKAFKQNGLEVWQYPEAKPVPVIDPEPPVRDETPEIVFYLRPEAEDPMPALPTSATGN